MKNRRSFIKKLSALGIISSFPPLSIAHQGAREEITWFASGNAGIVAAGPAPSAKAGVRILEEGGNAVDSAVAVIFNLAVSDYGMFSIGGESPFMYFDAKKGEVSVFNGMGGAPKDPKAIEWYYENGIPEKGIKAATTPSTISTCMAALARNGTLSFEKIIQPTLELLDDGGKEWYANLAKTLRKLIDTERSTNGNREKKIQAARDRFYKGDIADELHEYYIRSEGFLRKSDLETHVTKVEKSVSVDYRGFSIHKCNTWTQGPVFLQSLRLLEKFDIKSMGHFSPDYIHAAVEAMKLAFADRDRYYGDPEFANVPIKKLLSQRYTNIRSKLIDMEKASDEIRPGDPYKMKALAGPGQYWPGEKGTTTCVVLDKWGNMVAATPSSNPEYGICESLGIAHNTRLSSLNIQKGHPNALEAGKRPRITLTPTIVLKNQKPIIGMSVAGQDMQDQTGLQLFLNLVEFGMLPKEAMETPRFRTYHLEHSFVPKADPKERFISMDKLDINETGRMVIEKLSKKGHDVNVVDNVIAYPAMVYVDPDSGIAYAAADPQRKFCSAVKMS
ncbi:MAG: gamma-glutamyltransferase [Cyclobacteriaceae bacterium]